MIKDLMILNNDYIVEYNLTDNLYLYIEGLDNFGGAITDNFDINNVKGILVELHDKRQVSDTMIYTFNFNDFNIYDKLEDLEHNTLDLITSELYKYVM